MMERRKNTQPTSTGHRWGNGRGGRPWRRKRDAVAKRDLYTCQECGRVTTDGDADHIKPLSEGGTDDMYNLQWLCREPCHRDKTIRESGGNPKAEIGADGWPKI
jgi:5-methylcytosine-specific restriction protein A